MLKNRLSQTFFASLVNFYIAEAFETLASYFTDFWMTASGSSVIETAFCERGKNHKFENFKTIPLLNSQEPLFQWGRVLFYLLIVL